MEDLLCALVKVGAVLRLGFVVIATFACIWAPFLLSESGALGVIARLAPLRRGLFEDYVANFWCASSPLIKWKQLFSQQVRALAMHGCTLYHCYPPYLLCTQWFYQLGEAPHSSLAYE